MIDKYSYTLTWSEEDQAYLGHIAEFPSLSAHGETLEEALQAIKTLVGYVVEELEQSGEPIPEPLREPGGLAELLASWKPLEDEFSDVDEGLMS